jgi:hypothetical protein
MSGPDIPLDSMSPGDDYQSGPVGPGPSPPPSRARRPAVARDPLVLGGADATGPGGAPIAGPVVAAGAGPGVGPAPAIPPANAWQAFGVFILAHHRMLRFPALSRVMCSCGVLDGECPTRGMARQLGILPDP